MSRRRLPALAALALAALALAAGACGGTAVKPPPRSPLADTASPAAGTPAPTAGVAPSPGASPTLGGRPAVADVEGATALAIDALAEWLGIPATQLSRIVAEPVTWANACMEIDVPGRVCAQVLTPGYRVRLRDAFDGAHEVRMAAAGAMQWAGEAAADGVVRAVDATARRVLFDGSGASRELRIVPGTRWELGGASMGGLAALAVGDRVRVRYDPMPGGQQPPVAALVAKLGPAP
ncbi:MAG: hypothetical protein EXR65_03840 [Dehalococcoidia bacterium]|nr:hypothetical protein [Dehalococcoidia bacterium]